MVLLVVGDFHCCTILMYKTAVYGLVYRGILHQKQHISDKGDIMAHVIA